MSTRSTTHFIDSTYIDPVTNKPYLSAIVYRHSDGYPKGAGVDLYKFLRRCKKLKDNRLDDDAFLAARYVVFLGEMFAVDYKFKDAAGKLHEHSHNPKDPNEKREFTSVPKKERLDFISCGIMMKDPCDIEYRYVVDTGKMVNGLPMVFCFKVSIDDDGNDISCEEVHIPGAPKRQPLPAVLPKVLIPRTSTRLEDTAFYTNRFTVKSFTDSTSEYTIGQHKTNHRWQCSCMAHRVHGSCKHIAGLGLPNYPVEPV
jgi:hypothetical protein